jgi:ribosomal 50S subunit-recycling heat shock protein
MASVRVYQKKEVRLDRLNFKQQQMFKIGNVGLAAVKNRLAAAQGPNDGPAKPLSRLYAIRKTKAGKGNRRNLMWTGDMLRMFQVRTVSENKSRAATTGRSTIKTTTNKKGKLIGVENRVKAWITNKIEPWVVFSPKNRQVVQQTAQKLLNEMAPRLAMERSLGGRQI